ncbi:TlpA family protein disulfide reductase [Spirilliplanes yamanashiensis]|uniref:Thioredoxin domain-containing protein n=1 Tax=Spirilliplanes yamanashiensis TaxID=42233 RepID=A0A8J3Y5M2_9ACTN|nr:TlpA disulfide reductase family protein [Spirilliplanes yamanashiensis]MDP9814619.1 thiol-disulfide isomerase/thioredoxin [Spirilliplanes yamanashiensis]GIJ02271.1 hypothetical protein Sya03_16230 [Spirilliplanes yamanashiensis]
MRRGLPLAALLLTSAAAGCAAPDPGPPATPNPFAGCAAVAPGGGVAPAEPLPDLTLDCYAGGTVKLADVRGPALVNVWNTGCAPCREEMPALQRLADRTAGRLHVLGVVTGDTRPRAQSFGTDVGVGYPNVDDPGQRLMAALGKIGIPLTVLVDATGSVAHVHNGTALTDADLAELVDTHLGVAVPA